MNALQLTLFLLVALGGTITLFVRNPKRQILFFSLYGVLTSILFLAIEAPDVALSELAVGVVALPLMLLVTLTNVRDRKEKRKRKTRPAKFLRLSARACSPFCFLSGSGNCLGSENIQARMAT